MLGDRSSGKRSLIKTMNKPFFTQLGIDLQVFDEIGSEYSLLESSYLYMKKLYEDDENIGKNEDSLTRVNVWIINEPEMSAMISKILKPEDL